MSQPEQAKPQLTSQQKAALETRDCSIGLSAGAGCGKTFVLTRRFLTELEYSTANDPLKRIVAITFTQRAAREMRDRIRSECRTRARDLSDPNYRKWKSWLQQIDQARISTIDSFCQKLLRTVAIDIGIDPQFQILDEAVTSSLQQQAVDESLEQLLSEQNPEVMDLVTGYGFSRIATSMRGMLLSRHDFWDQEFTKPEEAAEYYQQLFQTEHLPRVIRQLQQHESVESLRRMLAENQIEFEDHAILFESLLGIVDAWEGFLPTAEQVSELRNMVKLSRKKAAREDAAYEEIKSSFTNLRKVLDKLIEDLEIQDAHFLNAADWTLKFLSVAQKISHKYEELLSQNAAYDFDSLLVKTRDVLKHSPGVRKRIQDSIDFLMVDEFQDTNPIQSEIVRLLCGEALTQGKLFLVGDFKQSIYRFRKADPSVFQQIRESLPAPGQLSLSTNFRSQPAVLRFVNLLFQKLLPETYEPLSTLFEQTTPEPVIEFLFPQYSLLISDPKPSAQQTRELEADWIASRIEQLLNDSTPQIRDKDRLTGETILRRVKAGDIVVLFRSLNDVSLYERAFVQREIDYYLVGGKQFYAQQEVYDLMSVCQFLDQPDDAYALVSLLRSPLFGCSDDWIFLLASGADSLLERLCSGEMVFHEPAFEQQRLRIAELLQEVITQKDFQPMEVTLRWLIEQTAYDAALIHEPLGERKVANLEKLFGLARMADEQTGWGWPEFAMQLKESVAEETREELATTHPESGDVVQLMTIHQSKGLEFPVVIVADMNRRSNSQKQTVQLHSRYGATIGWPELLAFDEYKSQHQPVVQMWKAEESEAEIQESLRLLYVALTRAADRLILSGAVKDAQTVEHLWLKQLKKCFHLETGLVVGDALMASTQAEATTEIPHVLVHQQQPVISVTHETIQKQKEPAELLNEITLDRNVGFNSPLVSEAVHSPQLRVGITQLAKRYAEQYGVSKSQTRKAVELTEEESDISARNRGLILHDVLEHWSETGTSLEQLVDQAIGRQDLSVSATEQKQMCALVDRVLSAELFQPFRMAKLRMAEVNLVMPWVLDEQRKAILAGSIDALLLTAESQVYLWDFKTGQVQKHMDPLSHEYAIQMWLYRHAYQNQFGKFPHQTALIWLSGKFSQVNFEWTEQQSAEIESRMTLLLKNWEEPAAI